MIQNIHLNQELVLHLLLKHGCIKSTQNDKIIELHCLELPDSLPFGVSLFWSDVQNGACLSSKTNIIQSLFCTIFEKMGTLIVFPWWTCSRNLFHFSFIFTKIFTQNGSLSFLRKEKDAIKSFMEWFYNSSLEGITENIKRSHGPTVCCSWHTVGF